MQSYCFNIIYLLYTLIYIKYSCMGIFQACNFLVSSHGHALSEERELVENDYSNEDFVETPFLFEQVP